MAVQRQPTASSGREPAETSLERTLQAEHGLTRGIIIGIVVAVPPCVATWVGLIALAVSRISTRLGRTPCDGRPAPPRLLCRTVEKVHLSTYGGIAGVLAELNYG